MQSHVNDDATMKKTAKCTPKIEWSRADAMTAKQRRAAAQAGKTPGMPAGPVGAFRLPGDLAIRTL
jgi:hypothetical protein